MKSINFFGIILLAALSNFFFIDANSPINSIHFDEKRLKKSPRTQLFPDVTARIVGGDVATAGRFPYMVALLDSNYLFEFCGGTLIAPNVVLSAAHCFTPAAVTIGCQDLLNLTQPGCEIIDVEEHFLFPGYEVSPTGWKGDLSVTVLVFRFFKPTIALFWHRQNLH